MDCGPSCLRMLAKHYGKDYSLQFFREKSYASREGTSLLCLRDAARAIGMNAQCVLVSLEHLTNGSVLPCIVHWNQDHFVVVYGSKNGFLEIADPALGRTKYNHEEFLAHWEKGNKQGYALLMAPTAAFYEKREPEPQKNLSFTLLAYLQQYRTLLLQLFLAMLAGSLLQLALPFLTQAIVDRGIQQKDIGLLELIVGGQLLLMASSASVNFLRSWLLFHISTPVNIKLVHDFLVKLTKLPLRFFDVKMVGDTLQRIGDHQRVEFFMTSTLLSMLLTMVNLVVFGSVLAFYSLPVFGLFVAATLLYLLWIQFFLSKRREIDYDKFKQMGRNQSNIIQLIMGMQEIRLNNCEHKKLRSWAEIQNELFAIGKRALALTQKQQTGCFLIQETQNIMITFLAARSVMDGEISLGMMLAIQFILGQLNGPVEQLIHFAAAAQDAKISFERIEEIQNLEEEENPDEKKIRSVPAGADLVVSNVSFQYGSPYSEKVLKNISLVVPNKKITAIVGTSGSGKTTLLKLLLGIYQPVTGEILLGGTSLEEISKSSWRQECGTVLQDGYIFSDTIAGNIALQVEQIDEEKVRQAAQIANIDKFIDSLPLRYQTRIGADGQGLSQGQKQRLLIARAIYKNPNFIFFDEATNALDANNEAVIMKNLNEFFQDKTAVIVAHRLSTVRSADQIIVLDNGSILERGTHQELLALKGAYYNLVKNQLELG
ncbi:MAG: peptidase domain-containing ABC transporter [Negativicutes bacterium]|nr:peptidase domain-containing ABC transporter [Negativicutes bacterium]